MDQVVKRPGALDVHKAQVTACVRTPGEKTDHTGRQYTPVASIATVVTPRPARCSA